MSSILAEPLEQENTVSGALGPSGFQLDVFRSAQGMSSSMGNTRYARKLVMP